MKRYLIVVSLSLVGVLSQECLAQIIVSDTARLSESLFSMKKRKMVMDIMDMTEESTPAYGRWDLSLRVL